MALYFCSLASGSSGNSYLVRSESTVLLVDCGISGKKILQRVEETGTDPKEITGLLLTHEHIDHVRSISVLNKKLPNIMTYSNMETYLCVCDKIPEGRHVAFENNEKFKIGDIIVSACPISHDAEQAVSYTFSNDNSALSILTDTGYVSDEMFDHIKDSQFLVLEANHDENILHMCRYPYQVKRRILSHKGHLSNDAAAECIAELQINYPGKRTVLLAHLSKETNSPEMAMISVESYLQEKGIYSGGDLNISVLHRDEASALYKV